MSLHVIDLINNTAKIRLYNDLRKFNVVSLTILAQKHAQTPLDEHVSKDC